MKQGQTYRGLLLLAGALAFWIWVAFYLTPEKLIALIGVDGGYLLVFLTALIAVSSLTSASFYAALLTLASTGQFNPLLLGLVAAPAQVIGDSLFFLLGWRGRIFLDHRLLSALGRWLGRAPGWAAPLLTYAYTGFTPLPQDFLMIVLGAGGVPFRRVFPALFFGNATFAALLAYVASGI